MQSPAPRFRVALPLLLGTIACARGAPDPVPRPEALGALRQLERCYELLHQHVGALLAAPRALDSVGSERLQVEAGRFARSLEALQPQFEEATAALSTDQLEGILPLWERMALAQGAFALLRQEALALSRDANVTPGELRDLARTMEAALELALASEREAADRLAIESLPQDAPIHPRVLSAIS
jgi:hypothetical protein